MPKIMLEGYKCERCGHEWVPRTKIDEEPVICPKCKSPYWNKPRVSKEITKKAVLKHYRSRKDNGD